MAKTVVPIELSSTPGIVDNSNATAITIDSSEDVTLAGHIILADSKDVKLGASTDMRVGHDGTDSYMANYTGDLYFNQWTDDKDIIFRSDDGSGGIATYLTIDGSNTNILASKTIVHSDNVKASFGDAEDLRIVHDGTDSTIGNHTGDLILVNNTDDKDIVFKSDDGSGGIATYITVDGSATKTVFSKNTLYSDSIRAQFGDGGDMSIFHNATDTYIQNATGTLIIENTLDDSDIDFKSDDGSGGTTSYLKLDGSATTTVFSKDTKHVDNVYSKYGNGGDLTVRHTGSVSEILNYTGNLQFQQHADDADIIFDCDDGSGGVARYLTLDGSAKFIQFDQHTKHSDAIKLDLGNSSDLQIYHSGSHSYIENNTGDLVLLNNADDKDIIFQSDDGSGGTQTYLTIDGSADRTVFSRSSRHSDNVVATFGTGEDVQIYHDGSNSYITNSTGALKLATETSGIAVTIGHSTSEVTVADNLTVTGDLTVSGTTTTVNSTTLDVADLNITVGKSATTSSATDGAGLTFGAWSSGTIPTLTWDHSNTRLSVNKPFHVTGALTSESLTVDDVTINGSTISDGADLSIDVAADLTLDAGGGDIILSDDGTIVGTFSLNNNSGDFYIRSRVQDKSILFRGNDDGTEMTALTLNMSDAGTATFNHDIILGDGGEIKFGDSNDYRIYHHSNGHTYVAGGSVRHGANAFRVMNLADTETQIEAIADGAVSLYHNGNKKLLTTSTGVRMDHTSDTDYSSTGEPAGILTLYNSSGSDGAGVNNYSSLEFNTGDGATSQGFINYIRTADNQGRFAFSQRTASSTYAEAMTIDNSGNVGIGTTSPNECGFQSGSRVLTIQGAAADDFGVIELLSPDTTSSNRIGEIRFGNMDGTGAPVGMAGIRARRNGADNTADLSMWTTNAGTFAERLTVGHTGPVVTITDDGTDGYEDMLKITRTSTSANEAGIAFHLTGSAGTDQAVAIYASKGEDWTSGTSKSATLNFQCKDDGTDQLMYAFGNFSDGVNEHRWSTAGNQVMRLNQTGALAIQTTVQMASTALTVYSNGNYGIAIGSADSTNAYRRIYHTASSGIMSFDSTGNTATLTNAGAWSDASDVSYKENIVDITYGLDAVKAMKPRKYKVKSDDSNAIGFIAQEMESIIPEVVNGEDGSKGIAYGQLTAVLVKAIQEQQEQIETLKKVEEENKWLKSRLDVLADRVEDLENK